MSNEQCIGCGMLTNENTSLVNENARLRAALEYYRDLGDVYHGEERFLSALADGLDISKCADGIWRKGKRARAALGEK